MKEEIVWVLLDRFFLVFHTMFTLFNMTGWIWKKTKKIHLATMTLTAFSWFVLGIKYGWGYCFCTDWHWKVREAMGNRITSDSYIQFLLLEMTGTEFPAQIVDRATLGVFVACFALSIILNGRDFIKWMASRKTGDS